MADEESRTPDDASRRSLLKIGVGVIGCGLAAAPLVPALGYILHPLRAPSGGGRGFLPAGNRQRFGGEPVRVDLIGDEVDAWSRRREVKIGSAWVIEIDGGLAAFSAVCPHLGCSIDYNPEAKKFTCPCHKSFFSLTGESLEGPSPRGLDPLDVKVEDNLVAIRYRRFRQGTAAREEIG